MKVHNHFLTLSCSFCHDEAQFNHHHNQLKRVAIGHMYVVLYNIYLETHEFQHTTMTYR